MLKAIVTGGNRGIGHAICMALDAINFDIVYSYNRASGNDVTDYDQVQRHFAAIGKIDLLVNNAGICINGLFQDAEEVAWCRQVEVNLIGVMNCCHAAIPYLKDGGDIINIASLAGIHPAHRLAAYSASKAGVIAFSEALAIDLQPRGIRVGCISPGKVAREPAGSFTDDAQKIDPTDVGLAVVNMFNMRRRSSLGHMILKPSFPA